MSLDLLITKTLRGRSDLSFFSHFATIRKYIMKHKIDNLTFKLFFKFLYMKYKGSSNYIFLIEVTLKSFVIL